MRAIIFIFLIYGWFHESISQSSAHFGVAKYAPEDGEKLLILGQDLGAVGGLDVYTDGYVDNLEQIPAGITTYAGIPGLAGLAEKENWGAGDVHAQAYLEDETYDHSCIAIGLYINDQLVSIADGFRDTDIRTLATWIKSAERPVFLRIGYEFDGPWNGLIPSQYITAWQHIVHVFDEEDVRNVAYVWQSAGINTANIDRWYPGDEYVNWVGYSHFDGPNPGQSIRDFAAAHDKPIMIAEATPRVDLKTGDGEDHWNAWFAPLFQSIDESDQIKALAYINANWEIQPLWEDQGWGDSRLQVNEYIENAWLQEVNEAKWLKGTDQLFDLLDYDSWQSQEVTPVVTSIANANDAKLIMTNEANGLRLAYQPAQKIEHVTLYDITGKHLGTYSTTSYEVLIPYPQLPEEVFIIAIEVGGRFERKKVFLKK